MISVFRSNDNAGFLIGSADKDYLFGMGGDDRLDGGAGNDTLVGGTGNDMLNGGAGDDTYFFGRGHGRDVISADWGVAKERNLIRFAEGINPADIVLSRAGYEDLTLSIRNSDDSITVKGYFGPGVNLSSGEARPAPVADIRFADGTSWDHAAVFGLLNPVQTLSAGADWFRGVNLDGGDGDDRLQAGYPASQLAGGNGNDSLDGSGGEDLLVGGAGDDWLSGGEGVNTYRFNGDWGHDTIVTSRYGMHVDLIALPDLLAGALTFARSGGGKDLLIGVKGGTQSITVTNYFDPQSPEIATRLRIVLADGSNWNAEQLRITAIQANGLEVNGTDGGDFLTGGAHNDLLSGGNGSDTLVGGEGNDVLVGGEGNDVLFDNIGDNLFDAGAGNARLTGGSGINMYKFGRDAGTYVVDPAVGGTHIVLLGDDVRPADVSFAANWSNQLNIAITGTSALLQLSFNMSSDAEPGMRGRVQLQFADGTIWSEDDILNRVYRGDEGDNLIKSGQGLDVLYGLDGNDTLDGYRGDDTLYGGNGNDSLDGGDGYDVLVGGEGPDVLLGGEGNDLLQGGAGNDRLFSDSGDDTVRGGAGDDEIWEKDGSNTFVFARGDGNDVLHITQNDANQKNVITFEGDLKPQDVWVSLVNAGGGNGTQLTLESGAGRITIPNYDYHYYGATSVHEIRFPDGTVWDRGAIFACSLIGNERDNMLEGDFLSNVLEGKGGTDSLNGHSGHDTLSGGTGDDMLDGGGDDANTYLLNRGDGADVIRDWGVGSVIRFGAGISPADIVAAPVSGSIMRLSYGSDSVVIGRIYSSNVAEVLAQSYLEFAGGARIPLSAFNNHAPVATYVPAPPAAEEAQRFEMVLPREMFSDPDQGDSGVMSVGALPAWLHFDPFTRTLSGIPSSSDTGTVPLTVTWTDKGGLHASVVMDLAVKPAASVTLSGGADADILTGKSNNDDLRGFDGDDQLNGMGGNDTLDGGAGKDTLAGGSGNDSYVADATDVIIEDAGGGLDQVTSAASLTLAGHVEILTLSGAAPADGIGNALDNLLKGNAGANLLDGLDGIDLLQGGAGNDGLTDALGRASLLDGGAGIDCLVGGSGNDMFISGKGADTITTGTGADLIVFNRGDGVDTVLGTTGADNTLSLGGGIRYADLLLTKAGSDLVLTTGVAERIVFKSWYAAPGNASIGTLQVVTATSTDYHPGALSPINDNMVEQFDFIGIVARFDQARAAGATAWSAWTTLEQFHRGGSDTAAIGGDLAYQYALNGNLANVGATPAIGIVGNSGFGSAAQEFLPASSLNDGSPLLY
ncbi:calcium-binding protein [Massilia sp. CCM 8734]|uniref:calcium-binding protein n=1 Tax=Massilia sp. CCM 8734 TaxID=2609283 RepID=UPI0014231A53|nr:calcium-binding protein [Massilia sp. CCM 8734]NHZ98355.1 hypothetical protein [Massilia sp. CCM 8734]